MADVPGLNKAGTGVISTNAFNLTCVTAALSLLIGGATVASGAAATEGEGTSNDWLNFDSDQRLVIIVAVIAAWAIVTSADILGRSIATGRKEAVDGRIAVVSAEATVVPLPVPLSAERHTVDHANSRGCVYAMRGGPAPAYLYAPKDGDSVWAPAGEISIKKSRGGLPVQATVPVVNTTNGTSQGSSTDDSTKVEV